MGGEGRGGKREGSFLFFSFLMKDGEYTESILYARCERRSSRRDDNI